MSTATATTATRVGETPLATRPTFAEAAAPANRIAVYRYLVHLTGDPDAAEDLTQAAFERALTQYDRFDPSRGTVRQWLVMVARRVAIDQMRSDRSRRAREERYAAMDGTHSPAPDLPAEASPRMRAAVAGLSEREREVVALRVVAGLDPAETARVTGLSASAVSTTLHRALAKMRERLAAESAG